MSDKCAELHDGTTSPRFASQITRRKPQLVIQREECSTSTLSVREMQTAMNETLGMKHLDGRRKTVELWHNSSRCATLFRFEGRLRDPVCEQPDHPYPWSGTRDARKVNG